MNTVALKAVLEDYQDRVEDALATELSRAQRATEEGRLLDVKEARAELEAIEHMCVIARQKGSK